MTREYPIISADSHITEHPGTYIDYIDAKWRDKAPRLVDGGDRGDIFVIEGLDFPIPLPLLAGAGIPAEELRHSGKRFSDIYPSAWDPKERRADQIRDGVAAEVIYPTVGMMLCNHADYDYKQACFEAYNRWIAEYCSYDPLRLMGCGQTAMRSPEDAVRDLRTIKELGLAGVMVSGNVNGEDFHSPIWNPFWEAALELELPLSFHILTTGLNQQPRGPRLNSFMSIIRGNQDIIGTLIFGGVFQRYPDLRIACVEADAGWVPHFMYRMDHAYKRHGHHLHDGGRLDRKPSEYFAEHVYVTFQDDWVAFKHADDMNWHRMMWANDFPHSDSTWPYSQAILDEQTAHLRPEQRKAILSDNVAELYKVDVEALQAA
jgi:predicted TIM-barrel fold metal-dependent hydrolase